MGHRFLGATAQPGAGGFVPVNAGLKLPAHPVNVSITRVWNGFWQLNGKRWSISTYKTTQHENGNQMAGGEFLRRRQNDGRRRGHRSLLCLQ